MALLLTSRDFGLPAPPETDDTELNNYLSALHRRITEVVAAMYDDMSLGYHLRGVVSSVPALGDLEEGQAILYDDGASTRRIYYRMNGALRYATLT